jgi:tetratricopeptide (TPR) repeat protein
MALISIITATLNRPSLKEACESVNNQTFHDWHHYVIGDGVLPVDYAHPNRTTIGFTRPIGADEPGADMPDGTPNPILRWALQHLALGKFVCFLDDDNLYKPEFLQIMHDALSQNPNAGIAICAVEDLRYGKDIDGYPGYERCDNSGFLAYSHIAKEIGFPRATPDRSVTQDYEFIKRCADRYGWVRVPEKLVLFGANPNTPPLRGRTKILHSWALPVRGVQLARLGRYDEAISAFKKAIEIDPKDAWTVWQLGETLLLIGRTAEGLQAWHRWFELIRHEQGLPPHDWVQYCRALVCLLKGDLAEAESALAAAIQRASLSIFEPPDYPRSIYNLALYLLVAGQTGQAQQRYEEALREQADRREIDDAIWDLKVLQATGLKIAGVEEALRLLQETLLSM